MRNSTHASISSIMVLTGGELSQTHAEREFRGFFHTCKVMFLLIVCDMFRSIASLSMSTIGCMRRVHPLFPSPSAFLLLLPDEGSSALAGESLLLVLVEVGGRLCMCQQSSKTTGASYTKKSTTRVEQSRGRGRAARAKPSPVPSLQEAKSARERERETPIRSATDQQHTHIFSFFFF